MTLEELWRIPLNSKWVPIIIEGKTIKDKYLRDELILRLDSLILPNARTSKSPDLSISIDFVRDCLTGRQANNICKELNSQEGSELDSDLLFRLSFKSYQKDLDGWVEWWGKNPCYGEASIFTTEIDSERCFFNIKTGKIKPTVKYVGVWPGNIGEFKEEIEWFAKEFPKVDLTVTFADENNDLSGYKFLASIHIYNGKYEIVNTKTYKNISKLPAYSGKNWKRVWKDFLFNFINLGHSIQKLFNEKEYLYWVNYKLLNSYYYYHYLLSTREISCKIEYWNDVCKKKNGPFWKFLKNFN